MNYLEIKALQTLEAARSQVSKELDSAYQGLLDRLNEARETYTPTGLLAEGIRRASSVVPLDRIVLMLIRRLKSRLF